MQALVGFIQFGCEGTLTEAEWVTNGVLSAS